VAIELSIIYLSLCLPWPVPLQEVGGWEQKGPMLRYTRYTVDDESRKDKFRGPGPLGYRCRETRHIVHRESFFAIFAQKFWSSLTVFGGEAEHVKVDRGSDFAFRRLGLLCVTRSFLLSSRFDVLADYNLLGNDRQGT
jgi:hypothetical protein